MQGHFRNLHFKTFPMVSLGSNLVIVYLFNQGFKHLGLLHKCNSQNGGAFGNHWLHFLHFPPFVKMCFTYEHTLLASWALPFHTFLNPMLGLRHNNPYNMKVSHHINWKQLIITSNCPKLH